MSSSPSNPARPKPRGRAESPELRRPSGKPSASSAAAPEASTRERLVAAMADALQRRGLHGIGLNELLEQAGAPKGVLYHHFPGGKTALAVAAIEATVERFTRRLDALGANDQHPFAGQIQGWLAAVGQQLGGSAFERGCPLATVALESTNADSELREALAAAFARIRESLARTLSRQGFSEAQAGSLASFIVTAYEGALIQSRVAGNTDALQHASRWLVDLLQQAHPAAGQPPRANT